MFISLHTSANPFPESFISVRTPWKYRTLGNFIFLFIKPSPLAVQVYWTIGHVKGFLRTWRTPTSYSISYMPILSPSLCENFSPIYISKCRQPLPVWWMGSNPHRRKDLFFLHWLLLPDRLTHTHTLSLSLWDDTHHLSGWPMLYVVQSPSNFPVLQIKPRTLAVCHL